MKALLLKDFYVVTKQLRIFLFIIPFLALFTGGVISSFAIFLGAALPMTAIAYDEHSKWNELATMMPYSKFDIIFSKYLLSYICILGASILSFIGQKIGVLLNLGGAYNGLQVLFISIIGALIFTAINNLIFFKFGSEKARFIFMGTMAFIGACGSLFNNNDSPVFTYNLDMIFMVLFIVSIVSIILNIVSVYIAIKIAS